MTLAEAQVGMTVRYVDCLTCETAVIVVVLPGHIKIQFANGRRTFVDVARIEPVS